MSQLPLGERLALIANKYSKNATKKRSMNNLQAKLAALPHRSEEVMYTEPATAYYSAAPTVKKNCGPKPVAWIGTQKNPAFEEWKKCSAAAGGARRRKTKKSKKSTKKTMRRRR